MQDFLATVREACATGLWSQGVKLSREGAVRADKKKDGELTFRVRAPGRAIAPTVTLFVDDEEWDCDCGSRMDPCEHVAAAAIDSAKAEEQGLDLFAQTNEPTEDAPVKEGHLRYELSSRGGALALERYVVDASGKATRLERPLSQLIAARSSLLEFDPTHSDLEVDRMMPRVRGVVPQPCVAPVIAALAESRVVFRAKEGDSPAAVHTSSDSIKPIAEIVDEPKGRGVQLIVRPAPEIDEVVALGVARCGDTLRALAETELTGLRLERLPSTKLFAPNAIGDLVDKVLPELSRTVPVDIKTSRLPSRVARIVPRIHFELEHEEQGGVSIFPTLVYGDPPVARVDGERLVPLGDELPRRDRDAEQTLLHRLRDRLNLAVGRRLALRGAEASAMLTKLASFRRENMTGEAASMLSGAALTPDVSIDGDRVDVVFRSDGGEATAADVMRAWRDGLSFVGLAGGGWAALPMDWLERHGHVVADLLAARGDDGRVQPVGAFALGKLCEELGKPPPEMFNNVRALIDGFDRLPTASLPEDVTATLRPYQRHGVSWLSFARDAGLGALLADDMGLGKTLQAMCAIDGRTLVVCPRSVIFNWAEELAKFRPGLSVSAYHGPKRALDNADVTLTTYATLRNDIDKLGDVDWRMVILDEAQAIKNPSSQAARAAFQLSAEARIAMTGTPVENRLDELWSQMRFVNPGLLGTREDFAARYARPIDQGDDGAAARLRQRIRPFILRRKKADVLADLPPRSDAVLHCELDESERAIYDAVRAATRKDVLEALDAKGGVFAALEALLRLRQAACHADLLPGQSASTSSKMERLRAALEEAAADGHKALVFSQWTGLLDRVEPHLEAAGLRFARLDGSTKDRGAVVASFQAEDGPPVMLLSLKAGGVGLNLTAADYVFMLDPWWNPAVEDQAADRAHRIGQDRPVMVYRMVAKDTVEERILQLQEKKRAVADAALAGGGAAAGITREDLLALLD